MLKNLETEIIKNFDSEEFKGRRILVLHFEAPNLHNKKVQNQHQKILNDIKSNYPIYNIITDLLYFSRCYWNFLALNENYQPVFQIPSVKKDKFFTIKISGKDLNLVSHFKSNILRVIKYKIE
ncbi:hypothetical protein AAJ76_140004770 [Vairimorpha ceranae]|uniref:Uncharacterized protein n=1 Tax=Vairimorpha ceranae TaxID=40302 RepID=A0A0F9WG12_9MICR|nr:hypothetical protein AAJ76_140004770 [Vairimorpha ceranae]KKO75675.1 hypothetical protein AAJ76_140004770 [Vairimorpha ceranae]